MHKVDFSSKVRRNVWSAGWTSAKTFVQVSRLGLELLSRLIKMCGEPVQVFFQLARRHWSFKNVFCFLSRAFRAHDSLVNLFSNKNIKKEIHNSNWFSALASSHPCFWLWWWIPRWCKMRVWDFRRYWSCHRSYEPLDRSNSRSMGYYRVRGEPASSWHSSQSAASISKWLFRSWAIRRHWPRHDFIALQTCRKRSLCRLIKRNIANCNAFRFRER